MVAGRQRGVVLIVALVILLVVTLLGVAVMQGATLELKMANNAQERQQAFNAAETALKQAENAIATSAAGFYRSNPNAFNASCNGGLCFAGVRLGTINSPSYQASCKIAPPAGPPLHEVWEDPALDVWNNNAKHVTVTIPNMKNAGMYIIEFRCFIDGANGKVSNELGDVLYRITARGKSNSSNSEVMVQSTYRGSY